LSWVFFTGQETVEREYTDPVNISQALKKLGKHLIIE